MTEESDSLTDALRAERLRFSKRLHDDICQHITGSTLMARLLSNRLHKSNAPEAEQADEMLRLLQEAGENIRALIKSLGS